MTTPAEIVQVRAEQFTEELSGANPFSQTRVLLIGDIGLDEYLIGKVERISPEAPVPVLEVKREEYRLGLSANVAHNIVTLGGQVDLISVIGSDSGGERLRGLLEESGVTNSTLICDETRPTTRKARAMTEHQQLVRVDYEVRSFLSAEIQAKILGEVSARLASCDLVILQDYAKGVLSEELLQKIIKLVHGAGKRLIADPHRSTPAHFYQGVDYFKPNFHEAVALSGLHFDELHNRAHHVSEIGQKLQKDLSCETVIMTRGKEGMMIFSGAQIFQVPTYARHVFDVTGAGDTAVAALALGLASGFSLEKASVFANFASGVVVGKVGSVPCRYDELQSYMKQHS